LCLKGLKRFESAQNCMDLIERAQNEVLRNLLHKCGIDQKFYVMQLVRLVHVYAPKSPCVFKSAHIAATCAAVWASVAVEALKPD
jgi:hypothetical protein